MFNPWSDDEDTPQITVTNVKTTKPEDEKTKILNKKDQKLHVQIKEQAKRLKYSLENKNYIDLIDIYEKLTKLYPQVEKSYSGTEKPKMYSKSLYLIKKSYDNATDDTKRTQKNTFFKLKKILDEIPEDITGVIEDYVVDKESDDELVLDDNISFVSQKHEEEVKNENVDDPAIRRLKWVKKEFLPNYIAEKEADTKKNQGNKPAYNPFDEDSIHSDKADEDKPKPEITPISGKKDKIEKEEQVKLKTDADIEAEYNDIFLMIGTNTKPVDIVDTVEGLLESAKSKELKIKILILCLTLYFDSQGSIQELSLSVWRKALSHLRDIQVYSKQIYDEIEVNKDSEVDTKEENEDEEDNEVEGAFSKNKILNSIQVTLYGLLERLDSELFKSLQYLEYTNSEYIERLRDEVSLIDLCIGLLQHPLVEKSTNVLLRPQISLLLLMHLYYKKDNITNKLLAKKGKALDFIDKLYEDATTLLDNKSKIKAFLAYTYYHALNNNFSFADSLFNKTNLAQLVLSIKDEFIKVLYNRTITMLGLSAFKTGNFHSAKVYLSPLCSLGTNKLRDNLFQTNEKISKLDKEEKKKLFPYIMTISIDEIETAYYISCLIDDTEKILLSRLGLLKFDSFFKHQISSFEQQMFYGNSENIKQAILDSCQHILKGDYSEAFNILMSKFDVKDKDHLHDKIKEKLKETSIKCYIILYQFQLRSISLSYIMNKFKLDNSNFAISIINNLILEEKIFGRWSKDSLILFNNSLNDVKFIKNVNRLKENIHFIAKNNILLLEQAAK